MAAETSGQSARYRVRNPETREALRYDGSFPLDFLRASETVAATGDGAGTLWVNPDGERQRLRVGDYLVREPAGALSVWDAETFNGYYEPVAAELTCFDALCTRPRNHAGKHLDERDGAEW